MLEKVRKRNSWNLTVEPVIVPKGYLNTTTNFDGGTSNEKSLNMLVNRELQTLPWFIRICDALPKPAYFKRPPLSLKVMDAKPAYRDG